MQWAVGRFLLWRAELAAPAIFLELCGLLRSELVLR
jgi:hypothetical protein